MSLPIWAFWLILSGIFMLIEIISISFFMFWPGIGALLAAFTALLGFDLNIQIIVFAISTTLMFIFMKPLAQKLFKSNEDDMILSKDSLIGKTGVVIKGINNLNSTGQVKVAGELWTAFSSDDEVIEENSTVIVEDIESIKLKVKKI